MSEVKERPILFSGAMVRAILAEKKSQTRRIVKPQPHGLICENCETGEWAQIWYSDDTERNPTVEHQSPLKCPYGKPGDRLYVRESWALNTAIRHTDRRKDVIYRADVPDFEPPKSPVTPMRIEWINAQGKIWRPSIHMPRWASRITLEIAGVRVERLQDISEADALAEGIQVFGASPVAIASAMIAAMTPIARRNFLKSALAIALGLAEVIAGRRDLTNREAYALLWDRINGKTHQWSSNPWVWVVSFRRVAKA